MTNKGWFEKKNLLTGKAEEHKEARMKNMAKKGSKTSISPRIKTRNDAVFVYIDGKTGEKRVDVWSNYDDRDDDIFIEDRGENYEEGGDNLLAAFKVKNASNIKIIEINGKYFGDAKIKRRGASKINVNFGDD